DGGYCQLLFGICGGWCSEGQSCILGASGECQCEARISEPIQTLNP
ncbi:23817_t:CDS:1, partial [Gigaspora rosea]